MTPMRGAGARRGSPRAGNAEPALARVPARVRRAHRPASPSRDDSFWTWRQAMYAFIDRVDADAFEAIAAQAFVEMAKAGYASVAEFHYVHHDPAGKPYADPAETRVAHRCRCASGRARADAAAGVLCARRLRRHADDSRTAPLRPHYVYICPSVRAAAEGAGKHGYVLGMAPHSLRAVTPEELGQVVRIAARTRQCISTRQSRRRRSTTASPGAACVRSNGCSRRRAWTRAGASCTRPT